MSQEDDNTKTVLRFLEMLSTGKLEEFFGMMAESSTWWVAGTMAGVSGTHPKAEFRQLVTELAGSCNGPIKLMPKACTAQGERVAVEAESLAHTKNGRTYNNFYHFLFVVKDGKIAQVKEYLDTMHTHAVFIAP